MNAAIWRYSFNYLESNFHLCRSLDNEIRANIITLKATRILFQASQFYTQFCSIIHENTLSFGSKKQRELIDNMENTGLKKLANKPAKTNIIVTNQ